MATIQSLLQFFFPARHGLSNALQDWRNKFHDNFHACICAFGYNRYKRVQCIHLGTKGYNAYIPVDFKK